MSVRRVEFRSSGLRLVGALHWPGRRAVAGAVVCHPHPLYGGTMDNAVVVAVAERLAGLGYACLRFNFRGVGGSEGSYSGGSGEADDACAAVEYLMSLGIGRVAVVGYSFGAYAAIKAARMRGVECYVAISPPNALMPFEALSGVEKPRFAVVGSHDELADLEGLKHLFDDIAVVECADHFWWGREEEAAAHVARFLRRAGLTPL